MVPVHALVHSQNKRGISAFEIWGVRGNLLVNPRKASPQSLKELSVILRKKQEKTIAFRGLVPPGTLMVSDTTMAFFVPAGEHELFIGGTHGSDKVRKVKAWIPAMVMKYTWKNENHDVDVYWSSGSMEQVFDGQKCLTGAVMPNISSGQLCLGSSMDKVKFDEEIGVMQKAVLHSFFYSSFNEWRTAETGKIMDHCIDCVGKLVFQTRFWSGRGPCKELNKLVKDREQWVNISEI